jgi:hypothetical protein
MHNWKETDTIRGRDTIHMQTETDTDIDTQAHVKVLATEGNISSLHSSTSPVYPALLSSPTSLRLYV